MAEISDENKTISEKSMLRLMNHCKAEINNKVGGIEEIIPNSASISNKLATMADVGSGGSGDEPIHVFSTEEKKVGKWIDGRDVFEKTFVVGNVSAGDTVIGTIENLDDMWVVGGSSTNPSNGYKITIPFAELYRGGGGDTIDLSVRGNGAITLATTVSALSNVFVILRYIKTT